MKRISISGITCDSPFDSLCTVQGSITHIWKPDSPPFRTIPKLVKSRCGQAKTLLRFTVKDIKLTHGMIANSIDVYAVDECGLNLKVAKKLDTIQFTILNAEIIRNESDSFSSHECCLILGLKTDKEVCDGGASRPSLILNGAPIPITRAIASDTDINYDHDTISSPSHDVAIAAVDDDAVLNNKKKRKEPGDSKSSSITLPAKKPKISHLPSAHDGMVNNSRYKSLKDLKPDSCSDFFAVVIDATLPKTTKGTDLTCSFKLVDPSCPDMSNALHMLVFNTIDKITIVPSLGDIVRVHRCSFKTFSNSGDKPAVLQALPAKWKSSIVVIALETGEVSSSTGPYTILEIDKLCIEKLRNWVYASLLKNSTLLAPSQYSITLGSMRSTLNGNCDLTCCVLAMSKIRAGDRDELHLFVWDATGQAGSSEYTSSREIIPAPATMKRPQLGCIRRIKVSNLVEIITEKLRLKPMEWIHIRGLTIKEDCSMVLLANFGMLKLPDQLDQVKQWAPLLALESAELNASDPDHTRTEVAPAVGAVDAVESSAASMPALSATSYATHLDAISEALPVSLLINARSVLHGVPSLYKVQVRVMSFKPSDPVNFTVLQPDGSYKYALQLVVEDNTARERVYLTGAYAAQFFHGIPAVNLAENNVARRQLCDRMEFLLLGHPITVCLHTYFPRRALQGGSSGRVTMLEKSDLRFQLCKTSLLQNKS